MRWAFGLVLILSLTRCASMGPPRMSVEKVLKQSHSVGVILDAEEHQLLEEEGRAPASKLIPDFQQPLKGYKIHSHFGPRRGSFHQGADYRADLKTPVYASAKGEVVYAARSIAGYGETIIIRHIGGYSTLYAHLLQVHVDVGERVERGQFVAYSGESGNATGPHLHFEIREGVNPTNPAQWLKSARSY